METEKETDSQNGQEGTDADSDLETPGFGLVLAIVGLLAAAALLARR